MKKTLGIVLALVVIVTGVYVALVYGFSTNSVDKQATTMPELSGEMNTTQKQNAVFTWNYTPFEEDAIPYTRISVTARYEDGALETKEIDTIEGSCNDYPDADEDVYENSSMIICYYAGLGRYYKVVETDTGYAVERKVFEEATPDYDPPVEEFEVIAQF